MSAVAAIKFHSELSRIWYCPLCPRLRRQVLGAGSCTAECNCIVNTFTATCLNGASKTRSEFCRTAPRACRRRLPAAKRRVVGSRGQLFAYFLAAESRSARRAETRPLPVPQACCSNKCDSGLANRTRPRPGRRVTFLARTQVVRLCMAQTGSSAARKLFIEL